MQLMAATRKFQNMSEWARDAGGNPDGPVEAQAFLVEVLRRVGPMASAKDLNPKGEQHKKAGAWIVH